MLGLEDLFPKAVRRDGAPVFEIPQKKVVAIDHPCIVLDVDKGIKSFGPNPNFHRLIGAADAERTSLPLWLRYGTPTAKPIMSHNSTSNNVVLKITVPKRTGRKRKRGSNRPFSGDVSFLDTDAESKPRDQVYSVGRQDKPKSILRKLRDNEENYQVEAVGAIKDSHRYRGLADFQFVGSDYPFLAKVADHLLPMKVSKLREFKFDLNQGVGAGQEIIPPPHFTDKVAPFNYFYDQNPFVQVKGVDESGQPILRNTTRPVKLAFGHYIEAEQVPVPTAPLPLDAVHIPDALLAKAKQAMEERPIWTRRSLFNYCGSGFTLSDTVIRYAIQSVGYQFKGGPFRDTVIKYGLDPRTYPKYRVYQSVSFKLHRLPPRHVISNGKSKKMSKEDEKVSHMWDGQSFCTNGKFWQMCDVTDKTLLKLMEDAPIRPECDLNDGWWYPGTWAKIKAYMKAKMIAIQAGRLGSPDDEPKKKGFIYDSVLIQQLAKYADNPVNTAPNTGRVVHINMLLYGMEDVPGLEGLKFKKKASVARDPFAAMGFGPPKRARATYASKPRLLEQYAEDPEGNDFKMGAENSEAGPTRTEEDQGDWKDIGYPDEAWAHVLDSDLSDDNADENEGAEGEYDGDNTNFFDNHGAVDVELEVDGDEDEMGRDTAFFDSDGYEIETEQGVFNDEFVEEDDFDEQEF